MKEVYIYILSHPITNEIRYVGQTIDINARFYRHIFDANQNGFKNHRTAWVKSLLNEGLKPNIDVIDVVNETNWSFWERYWISQFRTWGFNLVNSGDGGEGTYGRIVSEATKIKMSETKKGKTPKNIGLLVKSRVKPVIQMKLNGEFVKEWESVNQAKNHLLINNIERAVKHERKVAGGYLWRYKEM